MMTVTLVIHQTTDSKSDNKGHYDATEIVIKQPGAAGFPGTEERREIGADNARVWRDHEDHVFGSVKGK